MPGTSPGMTTWRKTGKNSSNPPDGEDTAYGFRAQPFGLPRNDGGESGAVI